MLVADNAQNPRAWHGLLAHGLSDMLISHCEPVSPALHRQEAIGGSVFVATHVPPLRQYPDGKELQGLSKSSTSHDKFFLLKNQRTTVFHLPYWQNVPTLLP